MADENVQEAVSKLFTLPVFVLTGALLLPWSDWAARGWALGLFALAVLALRRPLTLLVLASFSGMTRGHGPSPARPSPPRS